jgi:hypothetical protein
MKKANEQQKEKYKWMYEEEDQLMLEDDKDKTKLIEGPDQSRNAEIASWKYKVIRNFLFLFYRPCIATFFFFLKKKMDFQCIFFFFASNLKDLQLSYVLSGRS